MGLSSGELVDEDGKLVAYSTSRMRIFGDAAAGAPARGGTAAQPARSSRSANAEDGPDPYLQGMEARSKPGPRSCTGAGA
jgi:hypothetical protein